MTRLTSEQAAVKVQIDAIDALLAKLTMALDQEKADFPRQGWAAAGELEYVAKGLQEALDFWTQEGEYAETVPAPQVTVRTYHSRHLGGVTVPEE